MDVGNILTGGYVSAYMFFHGGVFCVYPNTLYLVGLSGTGCNYKGIFFYYPI